ncbi:hypothetical protein ACFX13_041450 [Malus domestica]|uniref:WRC domain-containing protein n=1 Tax=Malus domestica TaxID=3750 RepID=A0A498JK10_MALDO|nr:hypothetical protein DVH24_014227 [Malus domestica]
MRIRKNAKVSPLLFTSHAPDAEELLPHVCQINRNPWDIIPFGPESDQWEVEESLYGGSFGDSIGAVESVASLRDGADEKPLEKNEGPVAEGIDIENNWKAGDERTGSMCCQQNDGRGWHCKKKAKQGESFCNHHLSLLRSNCIVKANGNGYCRDNGNNHNISSKKAAAAVSGAVQLKNGGGGGRKKVKKESAPNPYEFYYYSGFGPWRSRKRGGDKEKEETKAEGEIATTTSFPPHPHESAHRSPSSPIANGEFDYNDEDDEDDDDELDGSGVSSRKRMRKPVKERSLKSLM